MVKITQYFLTENDCYKIGKKHTPKGIMLHTTGANNPELRRYIGPDDGIIGQNQYNNHWNQPGIKKCVHAFIGKDKNGVVRIYQTLPWDMVGWHSGNGPKGNANYMDFIGFEICEDDREDEAYFNECYSQAVELCAFLVKEYPTIKVQNIIGHYEGYQRGIASNHSDPKPWFSKFNKTMDDFRADVKKKLKETEKSKEKLAVDGFWGPETTKELQRTIGTPIDGVISGQYRNYITNAIYSAKFGPPFTGSQVIRAVQKKIGAKVDGFIGPQTVRALQKYLGTPVDGKISKPSLMVKEMQRRLNANKF